jgi:hypothetical protein
LYRIVKRIIPVGHWLGQWHTIPVSSSQITTSWYLVAHLHLANDTQEASEYFWGLSMKSWGLCARQHDKQLPKANNWELESKTMCHLSWITDPST